MATRRAPRALWRPATGATPGTAVGATFTSGGTVTTPAIATTSFRTQRRRTNFAASGATPAGLTAVDPLTLTAVAGGGLAFYAEFALATNPASTRLFVGLSAQASVCTNNPSSATNLNTIGVGFDASDAIGSGLYFVSRGNAGGVSNWKIPLGTGTPASKVGGYASRGTGDVFGLFIHAGPNAAARGYLVVLANLTNQAIVFWHVVTTNIPIDTSLLRACAQVQGTGAQLDLYSLDLDTSFDGIFDVRDFAAVGDGNADDFGAIQAALFAASGAYTTGDSPVGGSVVRVPPGRYRCTRPINVLGGVLLEGAQASGGEGGSTLVFDADVGEGSIGDPALGGCLTIENTFSFPFPARAANTAYVAGDIVVPPAVNGYYYRCTAPGTSAAGAVVWTTSGTFGGATVTDGGVTWLCCGLVPSANGAIVRNLGLLQLPGGNRVKLCHGVMVRTVAHLENLFIQGFTGDGIHIYGNNVGFPYSVCNGWSISGATQVSQCKRNGVFVAGQDANSGTMSGPFQAIDCDAYALWNSDPTGNCYQSVGGEGCGVYVNPLDGHWNTAGGTDIDSEKWTPAATYAIGERVLPTVNNRSGFQYVVTVAGTIPFGALEPAWPTVIGDYVDQGPVRFTCWMHEGGTVRTDNGGICSFGHIHGEEEKPGADFATAAVLMSANKEHTLTLGSSVYFGMSKGALLPFSVTSRGQELWETTPEQVLSVAIGSGPSTPYVAYQFDASLRDYYKNGADVSVPDEGYVQRFFTDKNEEYARWREQWGSGSTFGLSYSQCGGASLPQPGAICFANYWLGAQVGLEARHSAINPTGDATSDGPYYPNILDGANWERAFGAWGPGDIVWNLCGQAEGPLSRWPVAWRFRRYAARRFDTTAWATSTDYIAGTLIKPATNNPNDYVFQAMFAARTTDNAGDEPDWSAAAIGSTFTEVNVAAGKRPQKWRCVGTELNVDSGVAGLYEPMITQSPTMTVVDLSSVAVATIELAPEDAAYERIKLVRTDPEQGASIVKLPRGAGDGWWKFFWNASGTELLIQMIGGGATVLMPATPNPNGAVIASDGVDLLKST